MRENGAMEALLNSTCNLTQCIGNNNVTMEQSDEGNLTFEAVVKVVVPIIFSLIAILGLVGNLLVIIVVSFNNQMRNTTNLLILNLAIADLFFIIICVPFTAMVYSMSQWPFGSVWCKIYQYLLNVTAYSSVYTLVLMSLDRYLAVVHPISSMTIRNDRNAYILILLSWFIICFSNIPVILQYEAYIYTWAGEERSTCLSIWMLQDNPKQGRIFYGCFFAFGYLMPLGLVCLLYGAMLKRLLHGVVPRGCQSGEASRSKRRVTRMIVIVVVLFAICWLPFQVIFMIQFFGSYPDSPIFMGIKIASNCIAYMNSCVNPILYAFLSENFRKGFRKVLSFGRQASHRYDFERSNTRAMDPLTRTTNREENGV